VIDDPELEEQEEEEEEEADEKVELQSEIGRLIEVMIPPVTDQDIVDLALHLKPLSSPRDEMFERIIEAIKQGKTKQR
jgi:hypothetical protein